MDTFFLADFFNSYLETAFWSSNDESDERGGEPLDKNYSPDDLNPDAKVKMLADCQQFIKANEKDLEGLDPGQCGHDFWLNRNGHGAGFWDGDYPEEIGDRLDKSATSFGECNLYVGDDKKIYIL